MVRDSYWTVSQLAGLIQNTLSKEPLLKGLWVRGEISNFKRHSSGHLYFSVKDKTAAMRAVMFRGAAGRLRCRPEDGLDCFFWGYVALYAREAQLQFYVEEIEPAGAGAEAQALEALKKKLTAAGYFDPAHKKPVPALPRAVGVISSPTGAVIQDIKKVLWRRYPGMPIKLYPAAVQGKEAVESVVQGLRAMDALDVDVVILARGGGSAEDLSAFDREEIVLAIHRCHKPVISAVGHETDVSLADLAADLRAATPSAAAELAVPVWEDLRALLAQQARRLGGGLLRDVDRQRERLARLRGSYVFTTPGRLLESRRESLSRLKNSFVFTQTQRLLDPYRERLARGQEKMTERLSRVLSERRHSLGQQAAKLDTLSPLATLARGYAICQDETGRVIYEAAQAEVGQSLAVRLAAGRLACRVERVDGGHGEAGARTS